MNNTTRYVLVGALIVAAFFGAYKFAAARGAQAQSAAVQTAAASAYVASGAAGSSVQSGAGVATGSTGTGGSCCGGTATGGSGGCCGGGSGSQQQVAGTAQQSGGVQKISVQVTTQYSPNVLELKAGVPAEITFSQAQGCTSLVQSRSLGFAEDLSTGAKTVKLQGLQPGTYDFECGMNMVHGTIVVR